MKELLVYVLQIADNALIHGHRLSEWCGHGPILEQDIAMTNMALDHIGQARSLFQYASELYNQLDKATQEELFSSATLLAYTDNSEEDTLPYLRDAWDFKNSLLVELPNEDWAYTIAKCFFYDHFTVLFYEALQTVNNEKLAAIAQKSLKEALYHRKWSSEWLIRLGDGTAESNERMQKALDEYWVYIGDLFESSEADKALVASLKVPNLSELYTKWLLNVTEVVKEATLTVPSNEWRQLGGKEGKHTENLGYILAEMQFLQRAYPGAQW
jgi:ring-1,2-phenylacetyl-CoA epoxidase subunit PaaC